MPLLIVCLTLLLPSYVWADSVDQLRKALHRPVPGGVAVLETAAYGAKPKVTFRDSPVLLQQNVDSQWWAIVGISLDTQTGPAHLEVQTSAGTYPITFLVEPYTYKSQHIRLKNKAMVSPPPEILERITLELNEQRQAYKTFTDRDPSNILFDAPVPGRLSSPFGLRRFFNGQPRNPHSGLDFAAAQGTPVKVPADGEILYIGDLYFNGLTVFVDHGSGLISMFCHLSEINHLPGDQLKRGDIIGAVGSTGRSTGAHLHWNVSLNNARVDPALFLRPK
jgi:murein DD-endopeptidase MepM/ murein hydrolase activator NlpD